MDDSTISAVVVEIAPLLRGRAAGKIFQLDQQSLAIDFGLRREGYLYLSVNPVLPRLYLIKRRVRDLEKAPLSHFSLIVRKELSQTRVSSVDKVADDRIVSLKFEGADELGGYKERSLVAQLTGRSANLLLLDEASVIISQLRAARVGGQTLGERYEPPVTQPVGGATGRERSSVIKSFTASEGRTVSESLDAHYAALAAQQAVQSQLSAARANA